MRRIALPSSVSWALALLLAGPIAGTIRADLLYFEKGGRVQAPVSTEGNLVRVETPAGRFTFLRADFRAVVPGHWPELQWPARRKSALAGDVRARFEAAWWALENGLTPQAEAMLRDVLAADPKHEAADRMVVILKQLERPCADPDLAPLEDALGGRCETARGPHVVLVHQLEESEAQERIDLLERVVRTYYLMFAAYGVELTVPSQRLASACFANQGEYRAYLRAEHAGAFQSTKGYYHPTRKAVFCLDSRNTGSLKEASDAIVAGRRELERLSQTIARMPGNAQARIDFPNEPARTVNRSDAKEILDRLGRDLDRQRLLWELSRRAIDHGTAAHEMVHQLVSTSGLIAHHDDFPTWLHEGLAAQFEVIRGGRWAGVGRAHDLRLPDWRSIRPRPRLAPLIRDEGFGRGYQRDLYAATWSLVYYLRNRHPHEFLTYLDLLRSPARRSLERSDRALALFRSAFGDELEELEAEWYRFTESLKTPLEAGEPSQAAVSSKPHPGRG